MIPVNDPTGDRTASLIFRYSLYLSALPPLATLAGLTSSMFLVEGTALNLYLLYLSQTFSRDRTNSSARRIFLTSLWYLPLLLAGFFIHHNDNKQKELVKDSETLERMVSYHLSNLLIHL